jgi:hypothetical protein
MVSGAAIYPRSSRVSSDKIARQPLLGYLDRRFTAPPESAVPGIDLQPAVLRYNSGPVNDYYTKVKMGITVELSGVGTSNEIRLALKVTGELGQFNAAVASCFCRA